MRKQSLPIAGGDAFSRGRSRENGCEDERKQCVTHAGILLDVVTPVNAVRPETPSSVTKIDWGTPL